MTRHVFIVIINMIYFKEHILFCYGAVIHYGIIVYEIGVLPIYTANDRFFFHKQMLIVDDHSRVILTNRQQDYINANYIDVSIT